MTDLEDWLNNHNLGKYLSLFEKHQLDLDVLSLLTEQDIAKLELPLGDSKRLLAACSEINLEQAASESGQSYLKPAEGSVTRRQITVLICDMVGSTNLANRLDAEEVRRINTTYRNICKAAIEHTHDGYIAQYRGDAVIAYFGYPNAHENDPVRAILASRDIVDSITSYNETTIEDHKIQVHIGIATGPVVVGKGVGEDASHENAVGQPPILAARLQSLAKPNEIIVSELTAKLSNNQYQHQSLGEYNLKGFENPIPAFLAIKEILKEEISTSSPRSISTPLVGRNKELDTMISCWQKAKSGSGNSILIYGDPGIGKSRLLSEFKSQQVNDKFSALLCFCSPQNENSPLQPIIDQISRALGFEVHDDQTRKYQKLLNQVDTLQLDRKSVVPALADLLSISNEYEHIFAKLDAQSKKAKIFAVLGDILLAMAALRPVMLVFEDLHWIDPTSIEFITELLPRISSSSVLLILSARYEFTNPWEDTSDFTRVDIPSLNLNSRQEFIEKIPGINQLPSEIVDEILEKTDGVPLFIEETTWTVLDSIENQFDTDSDDKKIAETVKLGVPETLHDSLIARFDRLGSAKQLVQAASVIGRSFSRQLLATITENTNGQISKNLIKLVNSGTLIERNSRISETYEFRHSLIRDIAYVSQSNSSRKLTHGKTATAILMNFPDLAEQQPEVIAYHSTEAGFNDQAVDYWTKAAGQANSRSANREALVHVEKGLTQLKQLPQGEQNSKRELNLQVLSLGPLTVTTSFGSPELGEVSKRAIDLCHKIGSNSLIFPFLYNKWIFTQATGQHSEALKLAKEFFELAEKSKNLAATMQAHRTMAWSLFNSGNPVEANEHFLIARDIDENHPELGNLAYTYGTDQKVGLGGGHVQVLWSLGKPAEALKLSKVTIENSRQEAHALSLFIALQFAGCQLESMCRNWENVKHYADELIELGETNKLPLITATGQYYANLAITHQTGSFESQDIAYKYIEFGLSLHFKYIMPYWLMSLADACLKWDMLELSQKYLEDAENIINQTNEAWHTAEIYRLKGELKLKLADSNQQEAESEFRKAVNFARNQNSISWELRALVSMIKLSELDNTTLDEDLARLQLLYDQFETSEKSLEDLVTAKQLLS